MLNVLADSLLSLVYPQPCQICKNSVERHSDGVACSVCWNATRLFTGNESLCRKCGAYLSEAGKADDISCRNCEEHFYDIARAAGIYEKALTVSVLRLKNEPRVPARLRNHFISAVKAAPFSNVTLIVPVPLSPRRQLERGFNQAAILAAIVARATGNRLDEASIARKIHTPVHRAAMDRKAREMSVKDAFTVSRPNLIYGQRVLLVDDVLTSGSTTSSCAKVLKKNGAAWVGVLTLARAV